MTWRFSDLYIISEVIANQKSGPHYLQGVARTTCTCLQAGHFRGIFQSPLAELFAVVTRM